MKSIAFVIPYFGSFRNDFPFWWLTARMNCDVDFLVYTDNKNVSSENNIKVKYISFEELKRKASGLFDFPLYLKNPYKLCDFKPAYGEIFHEDLIGYDFWGHCDVDLLFGRIRHFFNDDILDKYDRILSRGHLTLYRNNEKVNSIYRQVTSPSYKYVFSCKRNFAFDEWPGTSSFWKRNFPEKMYDEKIFGDIAVSCQHFVDYQWNYNGKNRSFIAYSFDNGKINCHYLENGELKTEELLYVHYQKRRLTTLVEPTKRFILVPNKIMCCPEVVDFQFLKRYCYSRSFNINYWMIRFRNLRKKAKNFFLSDINKS